MVNLVLYNLAESDWVGTLKKQKKLFLFVCFQSFLSGQFDHLERSKSLLQPITESRCSSSRDLDTKHLQVLYTECRRRQRLQDLTWTIKIKWVVPPAWDSQVVKLKSSSFCRLGVIAPLRVCTQILCCCSGTHCCMTTTTKVKYIFLHRAIKPAETLTWGEHLHLLGLTESFRFM